MNRLGGVDPNQPDIGRPVQLHLDRVSVDDSGYEHHPPCATLRPALGSSLSTTLSSSLSPALRPNLSPALGPALVLSLSTTTFSTTLSLNLSPALGPTIGPILSPTLRPILSPALRPILSPALRPDLGVPLGIGSIGAVHLRATGFEEGPCGVIRACGSDQGQAGKDGGQPECARQG